MPILFYLVVFIMNKLNAFFFVNIGDLNNLLFWTVNVYNLNFKVLTSYTLRGRRTCMCCECLTITYHAKIYNRYNFNIQCSA